MSWHISREVTLIHLKVIDHYINLNTNQSTTRKVKISKFLARHNSAKFCGLFQLENIFSKSAFLMDVSYIRYNEFILYSSSPLSFSTVRNVNFCYPGTWFVWRKWDRVYTSYTSVSTRCQRVKLKQMTIRCPHQRGPKWR